MKNEKEYAWRSSNGKTLLECLQTKDVEGLMEFYNRPEKKEVSEDER